MTVASLFEWFAQNSKHEAELTDDPKQRETWIKLAEMWVAAAQRSYGEEGDRIAILRRQTLCDE